MTKALRYLAFEDMGSDGESHTWEAMASVAPAQLPWVLAEVSQVLCWAHTHLGAGPVPLHEGGDWDVLLQLQADDANAVSLDWAPSSGPITQPALPAGTVWAAVTMTLVVSPAWAEPLGEAVGAWQPL